jgi:hypothetical protein
MSRLLRWILSLSGLPLLLGGLTFVVTLIVLGVLWPELAGAWRAGIGATLASIVISHADRIKGVGRGTEGDPDSHIDNTR